MGFKVGSQITVDNALKTIMVKSANDMSVTLAEGVSGSIAAFAEEMNQAAARLGMTQTTYVNPNGLPADEQMTSARDQAILARAVYNELPEYERYWNISAIKYGKRIMRNYNSLLGRYPGTDGLKTGFICASGFNVVVSAKRNGRRLIAVMLGAPSGGVRAVKVAQMLERGFSTGGFSWLTPSIGTVDTLRPIDAAPPNLRDEICGKKRKRPARESEDLEDEAEAALPPGIDPNSPQAVMLSSLRTANTKPSALLGDYNPPTPTDRSVPRREQGFGTGRGAEDGRQEIEEERTSRPTPARRTRGRRHAGTARAGNPRHAADRSGAGLRGDPECTAARRIHAAAARRTPAAKPGSKDRCSGAASVPDPASARSRRPRRAAKKKPDPTAEATAKPPAQKPAQPAAR